MSLKIEVLWCEGCESWRAAVELVTRLVGELAIVAEIAVVKVRDQADADRWRFLGSPTVRVAGVDVEQLGIQERADYGLG